MFAAYVGAGGPAEYVALRPSAPTASDSLAADGRAFWQPRSKEFLAKLKP